MGSIRWFVCLICVYMVASRDEPDSEVTIFHTWESGLEGFFYVHPPTDIDHWVVHITFNKPVDVIEVSFSE